MSAANTMEAAKEPTEAESKHPVPDSLGDSGSALWIQIVVDLPEGWELDARELHFLTEACKVADDIAALDESIASDGRTVKGSRGQPVVNPAIGEARQLRTLQLRLLGSVELSDPMDAVAGSATPEQARKRKAAAAKWARENRRLRG